MTNPDLDALEADLKRQLDRTRRIPSEPLISIAADTMRALIAQAREVATLTAERDAIEDMAENVIIAYGMGLGLDEAIANLGAAVDMEVKPRGSIPGAEDVLTEHIRALTAERDALEACVELRETGLANALRELHEAEQQRDALKAERDAARAAAREAFADDMPPKLVDAIKELVQHSTQQLHTLVALKEAEENVAALTAERDALKAALEVSEAANKAKTMMLADLRAALEPFAILGAAIFLEPFGEAIFPTEATARLVFSFNGESKKITWGDFRRARAALDALTANARSDT